MAYVYGDPKCVRVLETTLKKTMQAIESNLSNLDSAYSTIRGGFNDSGVEEIGEAVKQIKTAVESSKENADNVEKALDAYAEYLESLDK